MLESEPQLRAGLRAPVERPGELDQPRGSRPGKAQIVQAEVLRKPDHEPLAGAQGSGRDHAEKEKRRASPHPSIVPRRAKILGMAGSALPLTFGRYEVLEEIARGSAVVTYRARDPK